MRTSKLRRTTRALEAARRLDDVTDDDRASLWAELGDAHVAAGEFGAAYDAYRHAYRLTPTDASGARPSSCGWRGPVNVPARSSPHCGTSTAA